MTVSRSIRGGQRARSVHEDWFAWLPREMDQLFGATRNELESYNTILSITLDEALGNCDQGEYVLAAEHAAVFAALFDRLSTNLSLIIRAIEDHGAHFGTLPNVTPLSPANFRGATAQRLSRMNSLLAKVVFRARTRFFHKLHALGEIIEELQAEARGITERVRSRDSLDLDGCWRDLEVLGYDLNTCVGETTVVLKSFFCALPSDELGAFRRKLVSQLPARLQLGPEETNI
jgi:hypothetical protein